MKLIYSDILKHEYKISPEIDNNALNGLFSESWENYTPRTFDFLKTSLFYICCYCENELIGFVNTVTDGYLHAFVLDVTVNPAFRRKGIGTALVQKAILECKRKSIEWIHVDYEPHLERFYIKCGFSGTKAGIVN